MSEERLYTPETSEAKPIFDAGSFTIIAATQQPNESMLERLKAKYSA